MSHGSSPIQGRPPIARQRTLTPSPPGGRLAPRPTRPFVAREPVPDWPEGYGTWSTGLGRVNDELARLEQLRKTQEDIEHYKQYIGSLEQSVIELEEEITRLEEARAVDSTMPDELVATKAQLKKTQKSLSEYQQARQTSEDTYREQVRQLQIRNETLRKQIEELEVIQTRDRMESIHTPGTPMPTANQVLLERNELERLRQTAAVVERAAAQHTALVQERDQALAEREQLRKYASDVTGQNASLQQEAARRIAELEARSNRMQEIWSEWNPEASSSSNVRPPTTSRSSMTDQPDLRNQGTRTDSPVPASVREERIIGGQEVLMDTESERRHWLTRQIEDEYMRTLVEAYRQRGQLESSERWQANQRTWEARVQKHSEDFKRLNELYTEQERRTREEMAKTRHDLLARATDTHVGMINNTFGMVTRTRDELFPFIERMEKQGRELEAERERLFAQRTEEMEATVALALKAVDDDRVKQTEKAARAEAQLSLAQQELAMRQKEFEQRWKERSDQYQNLMGVTETETVDRQSLQSEYERDVQTLQVVWDTNRKRLEERVQQAQREKDDSARKLVQTFGRTWISSRATLKRLHERLRRDLQTQEDEQRMRMQTDEETSRHDIDQERQTDASIREVNSTFAGLFDDAEMMDPAQYDVPSSSTTDVVVPAPAVVPESLSPEQDVPLDVEYEPGSEKEPEREVDPKELQAILQQGRTKKGKKSKKGKERVEVVDPDRPVDPQTLMTPLKDLPFTTDITLIDTNKALGIFGTRDLTNPRIPPKRLQMGSASSKELNELPLGASAYMSGQMGGARRLPILAGDKRKGRPSKEVYETDIDTGAIKARLTRNVRARDKFKDRTIYGEDIVVYTPTTKIYGDVGMTRQRGRIRPVTTTWAEFLKLADRQPGWATTEVDGRRFPHMASEPGNPGQVATFIHLPGVRWTPYLRDKYTDGQLSIPEAKRLEELLTIKLPSRRSATVINQAEYVANLRLPLRFKQLAEAERKKMLQEEVQKRRDIIKSMHDQRLLLTKEAKQAAELLYHRPVEDWTIEYEDDEPLPPPQDPSTRDPSDPLYRPAIVTTRPVLPEDLGRLQARLGQLPPEAERAAQRTPTESTTFRAIRPATPPEEGAAAPPVLVNPFFGVQGRVALDAESASSAGSEPPAPEGEVAVGGVSRDLLDIRKERQEVYNELRGAYTRAGVMGRMSQVRPPVPPPEPTERPEEDEPSEDDDPAGMLAVIDEQRLNP